MQTPVIGSIGFDPRGEFLSSSINVGFVAGAVENEV
jgi:hypothetical protein